MGKKLAADPVQICEDILHAEREYNSDSAILASENAVIDRLLTRQLELTDAYAELHDKLSHYPNALQVFFGVVLSSAAAFWNPMRLKQARTGKARLKKINELIAARAAELAVLLDERTELQNSSGFSCNTHYHVCEIIEAAGEQNYLYCSWVGKSLRALRGQFDLKYWPTPSEFLVVLASDAMEAEIEATDPITAAATNSPRASLADFFKALFEAIEQNSEGNGFIPSHLKISDGTLASLANCALDLGPDELVDGAYVKRFRQREREREASDRARGQLATGWI